MNDLMLKILSVAEAEGGQVTSINVWLGALSHMSPSHFKEHYVQSALGTVAEKAVINIEKSDNIHHPRAQDIILNSIQVTT
jgi:hydrogenase nickel incorporation protein HypA/HybF